MQCIVVHPVVKRARSADARPPEVKLAECVRLAQAIDLTVAEAFLVGVSALRPSHYIGGGALEVIHERMETAEAGLLIMDCALSPLQQRNLERDLKVKVLDRTGLILDIFGARAQTHEGKLQVEMAALTFQRSRLVRSWTHLERQRGGFGFLGGPGESQLEIDRRLIETRLRRLKKDLDKIKQNRSLQRSHRPYPLVALMGYTNVGKSTLFNRLVGGDVLVKDMPFATLDPTLRLLTLPSGLRVILSDTVGFISDLPTALIAAFRATLDDVKSADIIVHVHDASSPWHGDETRDVNGVLTDLGVQDIPMIDAWNKADALAGGNQAFFPTGSHPVMVSAQTGDGVPHLLKTLDTLLLEKRERVDVLCPLTNPAHRAWLHEHGAQTTEVTTETGWHITTFIAPENLSQAFSGVS
ncbi:MAG: GTPase HflX [Alphaproteobacteria bacterium]